MEGINVYNGNGSSLINFWVIFHFVGNWLLGGGFIFVYFYEPQPHIILLFLAAYWLLDPPAYRYFYWRWKLFKYNEKTTLSIDTERNIFSYRHRETLITFNHNEVEQWWKYECGPYMSTFIKILKLKLRNGREVIFSSGFDEAIDFLYDHSKELGLPKEEDSINTYEKYKSFRKYIEEIKEV